jgi:hypothetical protein
VASLTTDGAGDGGASQVCVRDHLAATGDGAGVVPDTAAISFYISEAGEITRVFDATEPPPSKPGDGGLQMLRTVSKLIGDDDAAASSSVESYFEAWNRRNMPGATALFVQLASQRVPRPAGAASLLASLCC